MAKKYPNIKYRLVTGNGPSMYYSLEEVLKDVDKYRSDPLFKDKKRFQPKYIVKITEEVIEIPDNNETI